MNTPSDPSKGPASNLGNGYSLPDPSQGGAYSDRKRMESLRRLYATQTGIDIEETLLRLTEEELERETEVPREWSPLFDAGPYAHYIPSDGLPGVPESTDTESSRRRVEHLLEKLDREGEPPEGDDPYVE